MKLKKYYGTDKRELPFVCLKKGDYLVATCPSNKRETYGKIHIKTEKFIGGTHSFRGLKEALDDLEFKAHELYLVRLELKLKILQTLTSFESKETRGYKLKEEDVSSVLLSILADKHRMG